MLYLRANQNDCFSPDAIISPLATTIARVSAQVMPLHRTINSSLGNRSRLMSFDAGREAEGSETSG